MNRKMINDSDELKKVVEYFNSFHDGFLKSIRIISGSKFNQHLPWEKPKQYRSNAEKLCDTGLYTSEKKGYFSKFITTIMTGQTNHLTTKSFCI